MRRALTSLLAGLFALTVLSAATLVTISPASAATIAPTTTCSNGVDNTPGLGLICEVTIVNTITPSGGSALVTVRECHGAAGDPTAACSIVTTALAEPVTAVTQCNAATNGGGGTLRCSVDVTNNFVGVNGAATAATVNQCVGSGASAGGDITTGCDPFPANTIGATITQCNGSANGLTLVQLTCTATGTETSAHPVVINQCNGSTNGGGALVICSANLTNNIVAAPVATPAPAAIPAAPAATPVPTAVPAAPAATPAATPPPVGGIVPPAENTPAVPLLLAPVAAPSPEIPDTRTGVELFSQAVGSSAFLLGGLFLLVLLSLATAVRRFGATGSR